MMPQPRPYNVVLVQPEGYPFVMGMREIGQLLHLSFASLGVPCTFETNVLNGAATNVLLGHQLIGDPKFLGSSRFIVYQLEQLAGAEKTFEPNWLDILNRADAVWDYSPENVQFLRQKGLRDVRLLPIGFHEGLKTIKRLGPEQQDIDVLFYGAVNDRRRMILDELSRHCRVQVLFRVYGADRDAWIARSKIVLNMHYYPANIMEQVRISYLLNNGCCVVSEDSPHNPFEGMIATAPCGQLAQTCLRYLQAPPDREELARRGLELFSQRPMTENLRPLVPSPLAGEG